MPLKDSLALLCSEWLVSKQGVIDPVLPSLLIFFFFISSSEKSFPAHRNIFCCFLHCWIPHGCQGNGKFCLFIAEFLPCFQFPFYSSSPPQPTPRQYMKRAYTVLEPLRRLPLRCTDTSVTENGSCFKQCGTTAEQLCAVWKGGACVPRGDSFT